MKVPEITIDDTWGYCDNHVTVKYNYKKFNQCSRCFSQGIIVNRDLPKSNPIEDIRSLYGNVDKE
jgi:hypothetical protein